MTTDTNIEGVGEPRESQETTPQAPTGANSEIDLLDVLLTLARRKWFIITFCGIFGVAAVVMTLRSPNVYTAKTTILPPQQGSSMSSLLSGQMGLLAGLAGKDVGLKSPSDVYIAMLRSDTAADDLIKQFDLEKVYKTKYLVDARQRLRAQSVINTTAEGLLSVAFTDKNPKLAAEIANAYVDELHSMNARLATTEAAQRRVFFEGQLKTAKDNLADAEVALKQTQLKTGMLDLDAQSKLILTSVATLKAEISAKEVQIQGMRSFATADNPDLQVAETELAALRGQLSKLVRDNNVPEGDIDIPTTKIPQAGLEYVRRLRDVKYYETLYELMAKQYEAAKLDEARSVPLIQVVDPALTPERKSGPPRTIIVLLTGIAAFVISCFWVLISEEYRQRTANDHTHSKIELLKRQLFSR